MRGVKITNKITSRSAVVDLYFSEINKCKLLTVEQEIELFEEYQITRDARIAEKIAKGNLRFVISVAKQYQSSEVLLSDLISEGNIGLLKAIDRFDHTRGFKFISFAVWWIRQSIIEYLGSRSRLVRIPLNKITAFSKIESFISSFIMQNEREPTEEEILSGIGEFGERYNIQSTLDDKNAFLNHSSLDVPIANSRDEASTLADFLQSDDVDETKKRDVVIDINRVLANFRPNERYVVSAFFGLNGRPPQTLDEIGVTLGLTRERVRQIKEKTVRRLRNSRLTRNLLSDYIN